MITKQVLGIALFAAALSAGAAPTLAKVTPVRSTEVWAEIQNLEADVNRADARDTISEREAAGIRAQIADIKQQYGRWNANGLTPGEAAALRDRIAAQRNRLHNERQDHDHHRG
jgi:hypothetical protein